MQRDEPNTRSPFVQGLPMVIPVQPGDVVHGMWVVHDSMRGPRRGQPSTGKAKERNLSTDNLTYVGDDTKRGLVSVTRSHGACVQTEKDRVPPIQEKAGAHCSGIRCDFACSSLGLVCNRIHFVAILTRDEHGISDKKKQSRTRGSLGYEQSQVRKETGKWQPRKRTGKSSSECFSVLAAEARRTHCGPHGFVAG